MTLSTIQTFPDGMAAAPGLALDSDPTTGFYKIAGGRLGIAVAGVNVGELNAAGIAGDVHVKELTFAETAGAGTYTGTIALPPGNRILDLGVDGQAVWNSSGAVSLILGDDVDPDGFMTATDLKATDLLLGEINNLEHPGGKAGAYITAEQRQLYSAAARNIVAVITIASGAGTLGRTRVYCMYAVPVTTAVAKV